MTIAPHRELIERRTIDPDELLIKEARQRTRRRRWRIGLITSVVTLTLLGLISSSGRNTRTPYHLSEARSNVVLPSAPCVANSVQVTNEGSTVGTGSFAELFLFSNISGHACSMSGYAKIDLMTAAGIYHSLDEQRGRSFPGGLGGGTMRSGALPISNLRAHGGVASFWIEGHDVPAVPIGETTQACMSATEILVTPPNTHHALILPTTATVPFDWCGAIRVLPVLPGKTGSLPSKSLSYYFGSPVSTKNGQ